MSSVRSAGAFEFHNVGDLTSTFTAPSSCPSINLPYRGVESPDLPGYAILGLGSCSSIEWDAQCTPNGDAIKSMHKSASSQDVFDGTAYIEFHSPGLACPSSWETVGVISTRDGSVEASGAFASTDFQYFPSETPTFPLRDFALNALTSVLAPRETAIVCCPSGFIAHPINGCYSSIDVSELAGSTGCAQQREAWGEFTTDTKSFEYFGKTITYENLRLVTPVGGVRHEDWHETTRTVTYTVDESGIPNTTRVAFGEITGEALQGIEYAQFLYLVNSGEESENGGDSEEGSGDGESNEGDGDGNNDESGARSVPAGSFAVISAVAVVWAMGFLVVCSL